MNFVDGQTRVRSRIDSLYGGMSLEVGQTVDISGLAVTPGRGVVRVEVDVGEGFQRARLTFNQLADDHSPYLWSLWSLPWTPQRPGEVDVRVRAWDTDGNTQDEEADFPYDSSAIHHVRVVVRG